MDLGLTNEQKLAALTSVRAGIQSEIYSLLIRIGVDPDTYDPAEETGGDMVIGERARVATLASSLEMIESKLAELS